MDLTRAKSRRSPSTANGRRTKAIVVAAVRDLDRLCRDTGMSHRMLARRAGVDAAFVSRIFAGQRIPSVSTLVALSTALGSDLSVRVYPQTGPNIRDRHQAPMVEALFELASPEWLRFVEVAVTRPSRGFIDAVLDRPAQQVIVAGEIQSRIDRLEQQLRWADDKARSLPSSDLWRQIDGEREISRLLLLRSTSATRALAARFPGTLIAAFPASAEVAIAALRGEAPWPGAALLWADVRGGKATILNGAPRGVRLAA